MYEYIWTTLNAAWWSHESASSTPSSAYSIVLIDCETQTGILKTFLDFIFMYQGRLLCSPFCPRLSTVLLHDLATIMLCNAKSVCSWAQGEMWHYIPNLSMNMLLLDIPPPDSFFSRQILHDYNGFFLDIIRSTSSNTLVFKTQASGIFPTYGYTIFKKRTFSTESMIWKEFYICIEIVW